MNLHSLNVRSFLEDAVSRNADSPYLIWEDEEQTYEEFNARVDAAAAYWHNMGVRKGDRVAFMADNSPGFLHAWLGLAKIGAVLPAQLRDDLEGSGLLVGRPRALEPPGVDLAQLRDAIRAERKVTITYADAAGAGTSRTVWPFGLGFFERVEVLLAWCELREDFRHFRLDRMSALIAADTRYPQRRQALLKQWQTLQARWTCEAPAEI